MSTKHTLLKFIKIIILVFFSSFIFAQERERLDFKLDWFESKDSLVNTLSFKNGIYNDKLPEVNVFYQSVPTSKKYVSDFILRPQQTEIITLPDHLVKKIQNKDFELKADITEINGQYFQNTVVFPVRKNLAGQIERLVSFTIDLAYKNPESAQLRNPDATYASVLSSGDVYKISVDKTGVLKLDKTFLETKLGIDVSKINPKKIKLYGTRGGRLPESNASKRTDDLVELKIFVVGEADEKFDPSDFVLFYAEGPDVWNYESSTNEFVFDKNIYDTKNFYFLKIDSKDGLRVTKASIPIGAISMESNQYDMVQRWEDDKINLLGVFTATQGTGKDWYGELFKTSREKIFSNSIFDFSGIDIAKPVEVNFSFAGRSKNTTSVQLSIGSKSISQNISSVNVSNAESLYARKIWFKESVQINETNPIVKLSYPNTSSESEGWLDYVQLVFTKELSLNSTQLSFRNRNTKLASIAALNFKNVVNQVVWDITDPLAPVEQTIQNGKIIFRPLGQVRDFIAHNNITGAYEPVGLGKIQNQNIHAMKDEHMIIVYHPLFKTEALRLAKHRESTSRIKVLTVETNEVYNEFSGGKADPAAIRDMAKLLLYRNPNFRYLLLFGDGSYDYKGLVKEINYENFVPVYQTDISLDPIEGFPSDDFYGLLGENEGEDLKGSLDIYVGRLPVKTAEEAKITVNKIIHYETSPDAHGDWRLRIGYTADDEDYNTHLRDMDDIAMEDEIKNPKYNQQKIYLDAFKQVSTPGESRYPDANKTLSDNIFKGQISLTYLGHGGPLGWAQERVLTVPEIQGWTNYNKMMIMVTATCSFAAYDDPSVISPAEYAILNPKGGAIALFSTTRAVYTSSNRVLTEAVHELMYTKINGESPTLGYILAKGKNKYQGDFFRVNSRKFTLIGDPSMHVAVPKYNIYTTKINEKNANLKPDTLSALQKITIEGYIGDDSGKEVSNFNGTIYPTIYDKKLSLQTLSNDIGSPKYAYTMYKSVIFKGSASVINGKWAISFWIPKNINYKYGHGRVSLYATDGKSSDASGLFSNLIIGGSNTSTIADNQGPDLDVFMNDENFVFGGLTNANPVLLLNLKDDFGINVTGNAIGQDITAVLDGNNQNTFILNDFYEAQKDDFSKGKVRFPLNNLEKGSHFLVAKAWDISGNSAEKRTEFTVAENGASTLKHVLNYPNPFTTHTQFNFEHDLANTELDILINIYTISGKLVKSIAQTKYSSGFRVNDIVWNGKDDYGSSLAKGLYLYKIIVQSKESSLKRESGFEKLIIL